MSTVKNADKIVAVKDGKVAEQGSHKELMEAKGVYHQLVLLQTMIEEAEEGISDDVPEEERGLCDIFKYFDIFVERDFRSVVVE